MGRPEADLDPGRGPVQRFAFELRKLRQEAGGITYRQMARQVEVSVAGLIPALRLHGAGEVSAIRILTPGDRPSRTHAQALRPAAGDGDTVIVVDQFEEVFTLCHDSAERAEFIDRLLTAREPVSRLRVVIAVRADFYGRLAEHRVLADVVSDSGLLVGPMSPAELREAVVKPAQTAGLIVERELTARLVREVEGEPGGLPLMSHVLHETWRRRRGRALTVEAYEAAGGLHGAIAQTAEDVHTGLSAAQAELARMVLLRLISPGEGSPDTRRPAARSELDLAEHRDDVAVVLDRLARARLITLGEDTVDLAHEALITGWPRLRGWIEQDRERLRAHRRLTEAAQAWDDLGRDPGALYRGTRLDSADEFFAAAEHEAALTSLERSFLDAARTARTRSRRRRHSLAAALATLLVLALVAGVVAWQQSRTSDRRRVEAEARRIAAVAENMRFSDPMKARRLSVAAWRLAETVETKSALMGSMAQKEEDVSALPEAVFDGNGTRFELAADGRTLITVTSKRLETWDVITHRRTRSDVGVGKLLGEDESAVVSPDGQTLALEQEDGVRLWDVRTGRVTGMLPVDDPVVAMFGASGHTLVVDEFATEVTQVWDLQRRRLLMGLPWRKDEVRNLAVSADDQWLGLCTSTGLLEIWKISERRKLSFPQSANFKGNCRADSLAFTPDSRKIAFLTAKGVSVFDFHSGEESAQLKGAGLKGIRVGAEFIAATSTHEILLWRLSAPDAPVFRHFLINETPDEFELDLAGGAVRYLNGYATAVRTLSLGPAATRRWQEHPVRQAELAAGGRTLATVHRSSDTDGFQLLSTRSGHVTSPLPGAPCPLDPSDSDKERPRAEAPDAAPAGSWDGNCANLMAFSADGRYFAYGQLWSDTDGNSPKRQRITVWDVTARRRHATVDIPTGGRNQTGISGMRLSADGHTLLLVLTGLQGESVQLWDVRQGRKTRTLTGIGGDELALRRDMGKLVTSYDMVADLPSGRVSHRTLGEDSTTVLAFSPDGAHLAVGDILGRVTVWDGGTHERRGVLPGTYVGARSGDTNAVSALAFSADGATLAVAGKSGTIHLWDVASARLLGSALPAFGDSFLSLAFSPDGHTLYAAGTHVPLQKYDIGPSMLVSQICDRVKSGLSRADWKKHLPGIPYRETC
ncbi:WD40 repeat domain-containing protein [Streptomyces yerevanensis]|uniref:WD40 repeat domain-containing protein n=1 Tax=Streptomyces yerevanensis TaxID=66378 RepID=UPI0005260129|nr:WD40 repeat domain-containing protein [Streptomyces yerevanensis]